jgi:hypothetical protein
MSGSPLYAAIRNAFEQAPFLSDNPLDVTTRENTSRPVSPALICVLALLSFAVFSWGLQYKLSLYHTSTAKSAPLAKLLSQRERSLTSTQLIQPAAQPQGTTGHGSSGMAFALHSAADGDWHATAPAALIWRPLSRSAAGQCEPASGPRAPPKAA